MPDSKRKEPWVHLRAVVEASVTGLHRGRFIEETLEALCIELGAASAWSTLETKGGGPMHRSRTTSPNMPMTGSASKTTRLRPSAGSTSPAPPTAPATIITA